MDFEILDNGQVLKVEKIVTSKQTAIVKTHYDFIFNSKLFYDSVKKKITAEVWDWQGKFRPDFQGNLIFDYEGQQIIIPVADGKAEIDFDVTIPGTHVVRTVNEGIRNGEVIINV